MKLMFASDIHGSSLYCAVMLEAFKAENAQKLILLGDILYHGPRNELPKEYDPKAVIRMLNGLKQHLLCVRGNCEAEVDQMVLEFPVLADYIGLYLEGRFAFVTHGHLYKQEKLPPLNPGELLIHGHTHVKAMSEIEGGIFYLNPGSVSMPKDGDKGSYMIYEDGVFVIKDLEQNEIMRKQID